MCGVIVVDAGSKAVRIPIRLLEPYDFTALWKHVDPNPTMNPDQVESMLGRDPNHRILYKTIESRLLWTMSDSTNLSKPFVWL